MEENNKRIAEEIINFIKNNYKNLKEEKTFTAKVNESLNLEYTIRPIENKRLKTRMISSKSSIMEDGKKLLDTTTLLYFVMMKKQNKYYDIHYGSYYEVTDKYFDNLREKILLALNFIFKKK